jgi:hypothetical protein
MRLFELEQPAVGDILELELGDAIVEAVITAIDGDEIIAETDNRQGATLLAESYGRYYCSTDKKWKERQGPKQTRKTSESLEEAEYQGRSVKLGKPMQGDVKKFKVYVKDPSTGNVKKVNFGDPNMRIKKSNPKRRKSFRARHNCSNPGPRTKARYWSCRAW